MSEDLTDNLPPQAAALIFHVDGSTSLAVPTGTDQKDGGEMPIGALAATELLMRLHMGEMSVQDLAEDFIRRTAS